jgi:hypothetical protein
VIGFKIMRFETLIALCISLLALFPFDAISVMDGGSGLSADQLIDASKGLYSPDLGIPENPQESRDIWSEQSGVNFTMPGKLSESGTTPAASRESVEASDAIQYQTTSAVSTAQAVSDQEAATQPTTSPAGNWSFGLRDSKNRVLALTLFQSKDAVFGTGTINDGGETMSVSASGTFSGNKISLDVTSSGTITLYRLGLTINGGSASGDYVAFSAGGEPWIGIAEGLRTPA